MTGLVVLDFLFHWTVPSRRPVVVPAEFPGLSVLRAVRTACCIGAGALALSVLRASVFSVRLQAIALVFTFFLFPRPEGTLAEWVT